MPNGNPEFKGTDVLVRMYRGGVAAAWDKRGMMQGYLVSKLMAEWLAEDKQSPTGAATTRALPAENLLTIGDAVYKKPLLMVEACRVLGASMMSMAMDLDKFARAQHSVSSSATSTVTPPIGNSAYVGMTDNIAVAKSFCSPTELVWKFDIWKSDLWKGGLEDEWLARGGTRVFNLYLSEDSGKTFRAIPT